MWNKKDGLLILSLDDQENVKFINIIEEIRGKEYMYKATDSK